MFLDDLFLFFVNNKFNYEFLFIFFIISTILVSLPIPYTFIMITNAYVFGWIGFIITLLSVPLGSLITYIIIKKLKKSLNQISFFQKILGNNILLENYIKSIIEENQINELHVFDFDKTLYDHDKESWILKTIRQLKDSLQNPKIRVILCTARSNKHRYILETESLLNKNNMSFSRHSIGHDGEQLKMTGQCRRE